MYTPDGHKLILVVLISAGVVENSQNGDSRSLIMRGLLYTDS